MTARPSSIEASTARYSQSTALGAEAATNIIGQDLNAGLG